MYSMKLMTAIAVAALTVTAAPARAAQVAAPTAGTAAQVLDSVAATPPLHRAHWGVLVVDAVSGDTVLERNADKLFIAASNLKLATIIAALDILGPDYRWETRVRARPDGAGVADRVVVTGGGDPTMDRPTFDPATAALDAIADSLMEWGLRRLEGPIVVEQSAFDSTLTHPAWEAFDLDWYYAAPVAPFAVLSGAIPIVVTPGVEGGLATVDVLAPRGLVGLDAAIRTVAGEDDWDDELRRLPGDSLVLRGTIGAGSGPDTSWIAQTEPGVFAGRALLRELGTHGVATVDSVVVSRSPVAEPGRATIDFTWRSPPLVEILVRPLEHSDNWVTEMILKTLGAEADGDGSWSGGTAVVERYLADLGVPEGSVYMRDGSGLSAQDLLTPTALVTLLRHARERPWYPAFLAALPEPGTPDGTLEDRLAGHEDRVSAKTGSLRHVNTLSGYVRTESGRVLLLSIMTNASGQPGSAVRAAIDRVVEAIIQDRSRDGEP